MYSNILILGPIQIGKKESRLLSIIILTHLVSIVPVPSSELPLDSAFGISYHFIDKLKPGTQTAQHFPLTFVL